MKDAMTGLTWKWVAIVFFTICFFKATARSEDNSEASAGTRHLGPLPFQLVLPREHLLGDWGGTRTWLEERGITPTLTFVTDSLGNPSGGQDQGFTSANNLGLDLNFDLEKLCNLEGASLLVSMSTVLDEDVVVRRDKEVVAGGNTADPKFQPVIEEFLEVGHIHHAESFAAKNLLSREDIVDVVCRQTATKTV